MKFAETPLKGAYTVEIEPIADERGFFARTWCEREFSDQGLNPLLKQASVSFNHKKGTLRGMHYQTDGHQECKLIRCSAGAVFDVIIDLRKDSPTFMKHFAVVLSSEDHRMLYVPEGFAHGFQTLTDGTELFYQISEFYSPKHAAGVRWNDPAFAIKWPEPPRVISARDQAFPDFSPERNRQ
ncbi:MAG: dTDP-4-dehydrorhamnose 3,5-epimerase [Acidobacteriota bacterium]